MSRRIVAGLIVWLVCQTAASVLAGQDTFPSARELYLSADYEGALAILDHLVVDAHDGRTAVAEYRVFCLLALDRSDEARQAIKVLFEMDPFYQPSDLQVSPRVRTVLEDARKALLPAIVQRLYAEAKAAFDKHELNATQQFDRLIALLDDPDLQDAQFADLRAVAAGFRDLSKEAGIEKGEPDTAHDSPSKPKTPEPVRLKPDTTYELKADTTDEGARDAPKMAGPLTGPPDKFRVSTKGASRVVTPKEPPPPGLEPPLALSQPMPQWSPHGLSARQKFNGVIEVTVDEQGKVAKVAVQRSMLPAFDKALIKSAWNWKYKPALLNGRPVAFVKVIEIEIEPDQ